MSAKNDLRFLSAGIRDEIDTGTRRRTGKREVVVRVATSTGTGREVVIEDYRQAMSLIAQLSQAANNVFGRD